MEIFAVNQFAAYRISVIHTTLPSVKSSVLNKVASVTQPSSGAFRKSTDGGAVHVALSE